MIEADGRGSMNFLNIWAILLVGLVLRLVWVLVVGIDPFSDPAVYETFARNIALHGTYGFQPDEPGAFWAVGASAIYAGAFIVFGVNDAAVAIINLVSSALIIVAVYDLGRHWFSVQLGLVAAALVSIWPVMIQFSATLASELHFIALFLMALMAWNRATASDAWPKTIFYLVVAGLLFSAATYVRPIALLVPSALAIAAFLRAPRRSVSAVLFAGAVTAIIFISVLPWSARNERIFGEPVFISTNFWPNFWIGNNPESDGQYMPLPQEVRGMSETERSDYMKELAIADLKADPVGFVLKLPVKAWRMHSRETIGVAWNSRGLERLGGNALVTAAKAVSSGWWFLMLAGGLAGIVVLGRRVGFWVALLSTPVWLWIYITAVHSVILVGDRFHLPAIPFIALLAALALQEFRRERSK